ncbi:MAG TPA: cytochrome d ubiquinol oxidase subunit II [Ktedonobacterales bacterium]|nr:cytochrome d ubiquinol oxidase subunit II [Ktedonobacterales bacterium]
MSAPPFAYANAVMILLGLIAYATLGGADFGGGVWDLLASGPNKRRERAAIASAIGPVWEANNVWLIFVIVVTWTAFPLVYATVSTALFFPVALALVGIVMRGAAFGFRAHVREATRSATTWGVVFSVTSVVTPFMLGTIAGALATGDIRVIGDTVIVNYWTVWTAPFPLACGAFALSMCATLAATYLTVEAHNEDDVALVAVFQKRAMVAGAVTAAIGLVAALLTYLEAPVLWRGLFGQALPATLLAMGLGLATAVALILSAYRIARVLVAAMVALIFVAWGVAQYPYLVVPDLTLANTASPAITQELTFFSLLIGCALLAPSLYALLRVFKGRNPVVQRGESAEAFVSATMSRQGAQPGHMRAPGGEDGRTAPTTDAATGDGKRDGRMSASDVRSGGGQKPSGTRSEQAAQPARGAAPGGQADLLTDERARERQAQWMVLGVSVALAIIVPVARQVWRWLWEARTRARVDREILRELEA